MPTNRKPTKRGHAQAPRPTSGSARRAGGAVGGGRIGSHGKRGRGVGIDAGGIGMGVGGLGSGSIGMGSGVVGSGAKQPGKSAKSAGQPTVRHSSSADGGLHIPTSNGEILITRRQLLYGALGIGAIAAVGAGGAAISAATSNTVKIETLTVPSASVFSLDDCTEVGADTAFKLIGDFDLPLGTLVWANNESIAACLLPTATASPLTQVAILHLSSGNYETMLKAAVGASDGFEIYDVRASQSGLIWTESNILEGTWRIYAASLDSSLNLGTPRVLEEGGGDWKRPPSPRWARMRFGRRCPHPAARVRKRRRQA